MARQEPLYVGTNGIVAALDPDSGQELWRTKLPKCGGVGETVAMLIKDGYLLAAAHGRVWCLDKEDGTVRWTNGLPKMGFHAVLLALAGATGGTGADAVIGTAAHQRRQRAAAAGGGAAAAT